MQQFFGMCQDGQNETEFFNVPRCAKCNSVLECAKMDQVQLCFGVCQDGSNATAFWNVPRRAKCNSVL